MRISVIIPAFNEENYLPRCLEHCLRHRSDNVHEVLVVDNACTDRTAEIARSFPGVRVIHEPRKGLTKARQCGFLHSDGDLLAFIDADTHVPSHWFTMVNQEFQKNPLLVALSGPYRYYDTTKLNAACAHLFQMVLGMPAYMMTKYMIMGGNFVVRRSAIEQIGGFDETIAFYGEDTNIARRLHAVGKVKFRPRFYAYSSARRFESDGIVKTGALYAANYLSEATFRRPATRTYRDHR